MTSRVGKNSRSTIASIRSDFPENLADTMPAVCAKIAQSQRRKLKKAGRRHSHQKKMKNSIITIFVATCLLVAGSSGCRKRTNSEDEAPDTSTYHPETTPATQFERDLKYIRDAH